MGRFPDELAALPGTPRRAPPAALVRLPGADAPGLGRTPAVQRVAEGATNHAASLALGRRLDATAGACWLTRAGAAIVLAGSVEETNATDLEWPALVYTAGKGRLAYVATEGLEFETAEFYAPEIGARGGRGAGSGRTTSASRCGGPAWAWPPIPSPSPRVLG